MEDIKIKVIEQTISDLRFIREELYSSIYGKTTTPALTNAIVLLRELESLKQSKEIEPC